MKKIILIKKISYLVCALFFSPVFSQTLSTSEIQTVKAMAKMGEPSAQIMLGGLYAVGEGVEQNLQVAEMWFEKAAVQGKPEGLYTLAIMHYGGIGNIPENHKIAKRLLIKAAERGHMKSQKFAATLYFEEKDYKLSAKFFKKAAAQGDANSQYMVGIMMYGGLGMQKDQQGAIKWMKKAAKQGYSRAQNFLNTH